MAHRRHHDQESEVARRLHEGGCVRYTHNFIKARLIERFVPYRAHLLDLGCGQGGDLLKHRRKRLRSYRGIDISHRAIASTNARICAINLRCRVKLECRDFCTREWQISKAYDAVSCQFALQRAFQSEAAARFVIAQVASSLKDGGFFLGTIPTHESQPSFVPVVTKLPGEACECIEYSATHADIKRICEECMLDEVLFADFQHFFEQERSAAAALVSRMRAFVSPDKDNAVFVYRKHPEIIPMG